MNSPSLTRRRLWVYFGMGMAGTFLLFGRSLPYPFLYDDQWTIVHNRALDRIRPLGRFFFDRDTVAHPATGMGQTIYRPLPTLSFAMDRAWGGGPAWWRAENLAWHGVNVFLVFRWLAMWGLSPAAAALGAGLFLAHPAQVESVVWVTQRSNLMATSGILAALCLFSLPTRRAGIAGFLAFAAGLFCKETAVLFPGLWIGQQTALSPPGRPSTFFRHKGRGIAVLIATALYGVQRFLVVGSLGQRDFRGGGWGGSLLLGAVSWLEYLKTLLVPFPLRVSRWQYVADPWKNPWPWIGLATALGYAAGIWFLWKKDRRAAYFMAWVPATLILVLGVFPTDTFMAERFLYLPLVGVAGLLGLAGEACGRVVHRAKRLAARTFLWALIGVCALLSFRHTAVWASDLTLWTAAVQAEPQNPFARLNQASAYQQAGRAAEAETGFQKALSLGLTREQAFAAFFNLALIRLNAEDPAGALLWVEKSLHAYPNASEALQLRAEALRRSAHSK